jgi:P-loop containing NTP hydrolase pore-1/Peptidase family S41
MELVARDLKALGLYTARALSFAGVEYEVLEHALTAEQVAVYDAYAEAWAIIHANLQEVLEATRVIDEASGETLNGGAKAAALSIFEGTKQRFFAQLLLSMKLPSLRLNNSLGDDATIAAFDAAMADVPGKHEIMLDLRDTPSGGNTTVARAIMGWFVTRPTSYQVHNRPEEERATGIPRQWVEQALPRAAKYHKRLPTVLVGRWTESMGEGLAIGFAAIGADVRGTKMAGLNGSVEDIPLGDTGVTIKLPTERLMTTGYFPREDFTPKATD